MDVEAQSGNAMASPNLLETPISWSSVHMDAIRGSAALVVMLGHVRDLFFTSLSKGPQQALPSRLSSSTGTADAQQPSGTQITIGNEMVILFFVLSGYLVGGSVVRALQEHRWSWLDYLMKRLTRLWVVLIPALIFGMGLDALGLHLFGGQNSIYAGPPPQLMVAPGVAARLSVKVLLGNAFFTQGVFTPLAGTNDSLWSLTNEFWYYLAFPALLLIFMRWIVPWKRLASFVVFVVISVVFRAVAVLFPIWIAGAVLVVLPQKLSRRSSVVMGWTLAVLFPVACVLVRRLPIGRLTAQYVVAGLFTLLLWVLLHQSWASRSGLYRTLARAASRFSYTLYLVHVPVAVFLVAMLHPVWRVLPKTAGNLGQFLAVNLITITVAVLFYLVFEQHTDAIRRRL